MAFPVINSPMFPSVADAGFLPPKLKEMPIFNPGTRYYQCEDGVTRLLTEEQAINMPISCKAIGEPVLAGRQLGQSQGTPTPASPGPAPSVSFERSFDFNNPFVWPGYPIVSPNLYPSAPPNSSCAWEKDTAGNDIYVCRPSTPVAAPPPVLYQVGPVSYPAQILFPGLY